MALFPGICPQMNFKLGVIQMSNLLSSCPITLILIVQSQGFSYIAKISVIEMERNKEVSYCWGAGGGVRILGQNNSIAICQERTKDFKMT
jgi:hypothetical protein